MPIGKLRERLTTSVIVLLVEVEGVPIGSLSTVFPFPEHSGVEEGFDVADNGGQ